MAIDWIVETEDDDVFITSANDGHIATCETVEEANLIVQAVHEYIDSHGVPNSNNNHMPRQGTLLRAVCDSIRRSRQQFSDRALDGVAITSHYTECLSHKTGECPSLASQIESGNNCLHDLVSVDLNLINGKKYRVTLEEIT